MAKCVDFLSTMDDSSQEVYLIVTAENGRLAAVRGSLPPDYAAEMADLVLRLPGYENVTPADGDKFLEALHLAYSGSRVRATEPYEATA
jgi:hypothetical protein